MLDLKTRRAYIAAAGMVLEAAVAAGEGFVPKLTVIRDGKAIAYITPPEGAGEMLLRTGQLAAEGFAADEIVVVNDTYTANELMNPYTMKHWQPGEMERVAQHHQGVERGWIRDALMVLFVRRGSDSLMHSMPYKRVDTSIEWLEPTKREDTDENGGWLAGGMLTGMMKPLGVFTRDDGTHPSDELVARFLTKIGADVILEG